MPYIKKGSDVDCQLRELGWQRTTRRKRRDPEIWKKRKWWHPPGEIAPRELIVRIVRHADSHTYRPEVVRVRKFTDNPTVSGRVPGVYWQPLRGWDMDCPLALAVALHLECDGDAIHAAYKEAQPYCHEEYDWLTAPSAQMPRDGRPVYFSERNGYGAEALVQHVSRMERADRENNERLSNVCVDHKMNSELLGSAVHKALLGKSALLHDWVYSRK